MVKKALLVLLAVVLVLTGCASGRQKSAGTSEKPDYKTGTPWLASNIDGVVTADTPAELKDDFYLYVNKPELAKELPPDRMVSGTLGDLDKDVVKDIENMFLQGRPSGKDARAAYDLMQLFLDWDNRNKRGVEPLSGILEKIEAIRTVDDLSDYFLEVPAWTRSAYLWTWLVSGDVEDPDRMCLTILDTGSQVSLDSPMLFLNESSMYSDPAAKSSDLWTVKSELIRNIMVERLGYTEKQAQNTMDRCFDFETMLAADVIPGRVRKIEIAMNMEFEDYTKEQLRIAQGPVPILEELEQNGVPDQEKYYVQYPGMLRSLAALYTEENLPLIKDYLIAHEILGTVGCLDQEVLDMAIDSNMRLQHSQERPTYENGFASSVNNLLPWPTARLYAETYLTEEDKIAVRDMVETIRESFRKILQEAGFLAESTRANAIRKLDSMEVLVSYPDDWGMYDCSDLEINGPDKGGSLYEAYTSIRKYNLENKVRKLSQGKNRSEWVVAPQFPNCFYIPDNNSIIISGSFLKALYRKDVPFETNMGMIGFVIAHEISHLFDNNGAQFNENGNVVDWWTDEDKAEFNRRVDRLVGYFKAIHPWEGADLPASILPAEACADMAGMKCILRIAAQRQDFDYDLFFRSFAGLWLDKVDDSYADLLILDSHPMDYLRVNCTLQQFDEFLDFYGITEGDGMYLASSDRVAIW